MTAFFTATADLLALLTGLGGVAVTWGDVSTVGVLAQADEDVLAGQPGTGKEMDTRLTLRLIHNINPSGAGGDTLVAGGTTYKVQEINQVDDGKFDLLILAVDVR